MKKSMKGFAMRDVIMGMTIITIVTVAALGAFDKAKRALYTEEKMIVKEAIFANVDPFSTHNIRHNISSKNIEKYVNEIIKENEGAVIAGTELPISEVNDYVTTIQNRVIPPVVKPVFVAAAPVVVAAAPAPVIEKITENHYHFEKLTTILKYIGIGALSIISLFGLSKLIMYAKQTLIVKSAVRKSKKIVTNFDNNFDENKNYLPFLRNLGDQVIINSVLIENRKNKDNVLHLIVNNEKLKTRLNLIESNLMSKVA